jgi:hypothetical protein
MSYLRMFPSSYWIVDPIWSWSEYMTHQSTKRLTVVLSNRPPKNLYPTGCISQNWPAYKNDFASQELTVNKMTRRLGTLKI